MHHKRPALSDEGPPAASTDTLYVEEVAVEAVTVEKHLRTGVEVTEYSNKLSRRFVHLAGDFQRES